MAYHMEQGSDVMDYYETMCNTIATGLTTGRVQTCQIERLQYKNYYNVNIHIIQTSTYEYI
jgi:hypothetical protein